MKIEKKGFTIDIDELEFFVPVSSEVLAELLEVYENVDILTNNFKQEYQEKVQELNLDELDLGGNAVRVKELVEIRKHFQKKVYDLILGEGAFDRLYKYHPYIEDLEATFPKVMEEFTIKVNSFAEKQSKFDQKLIAKAKKQKRKKK